jgi:hypothetical protein
MVSIAISGDAERRKNQCRSVQIPESIRPNKFSLTSMSPKIGLAILGAGIFAREGI